MNGVVIGSEECEAKVQEVVGRLVGQGYHCDTVKQYFRKGSEPRAMLRAAMAYGRRQEQRCRDATDRFSAQAEAYLRQQGLSEARIGQILMTIQEVVCGPRAVPSPPTPKNQLVPVEASA